MNPSRWLVMAGLVLHAVRLDADPGARAAVTRFHLDRHGSVYWVDGASRIRKDGHDTGWRARPGHVDVDADGNVVYVDPDGQLWRNGEARGVHPDRGAFMVDPAGRVLWIHPFHKYIYRDRENLGHLASWQYPIRADRAGNVYYVHAVAGTLFANHEDTGLRLPGRSYAVADDRVVHFWTLPYPYEGPGQAMCDLWTLDLRTGEKRFRDFAAAEPYLKFDRAGSAWYVTHRGKVVSGQQVVPNVTSFADFRLDGAGNAYTRQMREIYKNGFSTGLACRGAFEVSSGGAVYAITDPTTGAMCAGGTLLDFCLERAGGTQ